MNRATRISPITLHTHFCSYQVLQHMDWIIHSFCSLWHNFDKFVVFPNCFRVRLDWRFGRGRERRV